MADVEKKEAQKGEQSAKSEEQFIYLPAIIAETYAIQLNEAEKMIAVGQVFIDDKLESGAKSLYEFSKSQVEGKTIEIKSTPRSVKFNCDLESLSEFRKGTT